MNGILSSYSQYCTVQFCSKNEKRYTYSLRVIMLDNAQNNVAVIGSY